MLPPEFDQYATTNEFVVSSNITDWGYSSQYCTHQFSISWHTNGEFQGITYWPERDCQL